MMKDHNRQRYSALQRPILCFLATAREPISVDQLIEWTQLPPSEILDLVKEWREFLNERHSAEGTSLYHIYHSSFAEFLDEEEGLSEFHGKIIDIALGQVEEMRQKIARQKGAVSSSSQPADRVNLFLAYSHKDELLREQLERHLSVLKKSGVIHAWNYRRISAGQEWEGEIDQHSDSADVILFLVSNDFLDSGYCSGIEMTKALKRFKAGEAAVIPVILKPVDWKDTPFSKLPALPKEGKPVASWANIDEAFEDVATGIRRVIEDFQ